MGDDELRILLTGYLDGELGADDKARIERALFEDPELRAELDQMKGLLEMTEGLSLDERTDTEMEAFWGAVYNKLERHVAWVMLVLGASFGWQPASKRLLWQKTPLQKQFQSVCLMVRNGTSIVLIPYPLSVSSVALGWVGMSSQTTSFV